MRNSTPKPVETSENSADGTPPSPASDTTAVESTSALDADGGESEAPESNGGPDAGSLLPSKRGGAGGSGSGGENSGRPSKRVCKGRSDAVPLGGSSGGGSGGGSGRRKKRGSSGKATGGSSGRAAGGGHGEPINWDPSCRRGFRARRVYEKTTEPNVQTQELSEQFIVDLANGCLINARFQWKCASLAEGSTLEADDASLQLKPLPNLSEEQAKDAAEIVALFKSIRRAERDSALLDLQWLLGHLSFFNKIQL